MRGWDEMARGQGRQERGKQEQRGMKGWDETTREQGGHWTGEG